MKPQSLVKPNGLANEIRWTEAEREAILTGRLGHGDVSGWAKGVSRPFGSVFKPIRPEVGKVARVSNPVRKLSDVHPVVSKEAAHNTTGQVMSHVTKFDEIAHAFKASSRTLATSMRFDELYKSVKGVVKDYGQVQDDTGANYPNEGCRLVWQSK